MALTFLATIGKLYDWSGIRDIFLESVIFGPETVGQILKGKSYNRAVRQHWWKLSLKAMLAGSWWMEKERCFGAGLRWWWNNTYVKLLMTVLLYWMRTKIWVWKWQLTNICLESQPCKMFKINSTRKEAHYWHSNSGIITYKCYVYFSSSSGQKGKETGLCVLTVSPGWFPIVLLQTA